MAFGDGVRQVGDHAGAEALQSFAEDSGSSDAVDVEVAKDRDGFPVADSRGETGQGGVDAVDIEMTASVRSAVPDAQKAPVPGIRNIIAVGAGKGGVGKTTVSVNLAVALARYGGRVGIIDGDVYGPNVPIMLGLDARLESDGRKIVPAEKYGIRVVSMGFLTDATAPIIWRGPMLHGVVRQFFQDVKWDELDYLVVDMPPGTGDVALSLSQTVPVTGAVVVTTPQAVSLSDSRRAVGMYRKLNVPTLGIVENMSYYACSGCGQESDLFGRGGGERVAEELDVPFLGNIPLYAPIRVGGDTGAPIVSAEPESPAAQAFLRIAERAAAQISIQSFRPPEPQQVAPPTMAAGPSPVRG